MKAVEIFQTDTGREPFSDWLESLEVHVRFKVMAYIERVALGGSKKNIRSVGDGVFEIKVHYGSGYRIYFGNLKGHILFYYLQVEIRFPKNEISHLLKNIGGLFMYRHGFYNKKLARELKNPEFARGFLKSLVEGDEGLPLLDALKAYYQTYGS